MDTAAKTCHSNRFGCLLITKPPGSRSDTMYRARLICSYVLLLQLCLAIQISHIRQDSTIEQQVIEEQIEAQIEEVLRDVQTPESCTNTDSDLCCATTLSDVLEPYFKQLGRFRESRSIWHSNIQSIRGEDDLMRANEAARTATETVVHFSCRFQGTLVLDALETDNRREEDQTFELVPYSQDVGSGDNFSMRCVRPYIAVFVNVYRQPHGEHDIIVTCVNEAEHTDEAAEALQQKSGWVRSAIMSFHTMLLTKSEQLCTDLTFDASLGSSYGRDKFVALSTWISA